MKDDELANSLLGEEDVGDSNRESSLGWTSEEENEHTPPTPPPSKNDASKRALFGNRTEYLLSMVGYTVGLGNVWRWPYMCFSNGGAVFLVAYVTCMVFVAMPIFLLEVTIGQKFRSTPVPIWSAISPYLCGLGWAGTLSSYFCAWYYNVICAWSIFYLGASMDFSNTSGGRSLSGTGLPWSVLYECADDDGQGQGCAYNGGGGGGVAGSDNTNQTVVMNATVYWSDTVLQSTHNINHIGGLNWHLAICLALAWVLVFGMASKGVESAGSAVYVTATFPYAVLVVLLVRGLTLPGASLGLRFLLVPKMSKLFDWQVWVNALSQVLYGMGLSSGSITVFGSFNPPTNDAIADTLLISAINIFTNLLAASVVFSVVGFVAHSNGNDSLDGLELSGSALAFQTYSTALATMEGGRILAPLFFLMLLSLGIDSCFALMELVIATLIDTGLTPFSHPGKQSNWRLSLTVILATAVPGLLFVTRGGVFYFNVVDAYGIGPVLLVVASLECAGVAWIYGAKRFEAECQIMLLGVGLSGGDSSNAMRENAGNGEIGSGSDSAAAAAAAWGGSPGHALSSLNLNEEAGDDQFRDHETSSVTSDSVSSFAVFATDSSGGSGLLPSTEINQPHTMTTAGSTSSSWSSLRSSTNLAAAAAAAAASAPSHNHLLDNQRLLNRTGSSGSASTTAVTRGRGAAAATALVAAAVMQQQALAASPWERRQRSFYRAYWRFCRWVWTYLAPPLCLSVAAVSFYDALFAMDSAKLVCQDSWQRCPPSSDTRWAVVFGLCISGLSLVCIPLGALAAFCSSDPKVAAGFRVTESTGRVSEHHTSRLRRKVTRKRRLAKKKQRRRQEEAAAARQQQQRQQSLNQGEEGGPPVPFPNQESRPAPAQNDDGDEDSGEEWLEVDMPPRVSLNRLVR